MPRVSRLELPPLDYGAESPGQRLARFRREQCLSQERLANKIGITQTLVSDYERDRMRLHGDMIVRFALALGITPNDILLTRAAPRAQLIPTPPTPVFAGSEPLTPRETLVYGYLQRRWTDPEIAAERGVKLSTVKGQVRSVIAKMGVKSRLELALDRPMPKVTH